MYLRIVYCMHTTNSNQQAQSSATLPHMQAAFVRMLRNNPNQLVNCAKTPTAYI
jgi:hypothetical protein